MIGISPNAYTISNFLLIKQEYKKTRITNVNRRMSRTATLDGECVIEDTGYTAADRTFNIRAQNLTKADFDILMTIAQTYPLILITTREGAFMGAPDEILVERNDVTHLRVLIKEKLS